MKTYLYLSLIPESLIASMLPPEEFGSYYAVGTKKHTRGQAIFFEIKPAYQSDFFRLEEVAKRCVPHEDGSPRKSTYLGVYRVLEHVPLDCIGRLHLITEDGRDLALASAPYHPEAGRQYHLYQEFCPVTPRIVSKLNPQELTQTITDPGTLVNVPRIAFAEMRLGKLAQDVDSADIQDLPYPNISHLRDCLRELKNDYSKPAKTVTRHMEREVLFRTLRGGFYVGDAKGLLFYPMPSHEDLDAHHHAWWRSALSSFGG